MEFKKIETEHFKWFTNEKCEYYPCHAMQDTGFFNCLFCFCPLYAMGEQCGGNFTYTDDIKDCSKCVIPHARGGYQYIIKRYHEVAKIAARNRSVRPEKTLPPKTSIRIL